MVLLFVEFRIIISVKYYGSTVNWVKGVKYSIDTSRKVRFVFIVLKFLFSFDTIFNMALFRHTRQRSDLLGDISKFKEEYLKRGKLIELGWKEVPWVDGSGLKSCLWGWEPIFCVVVNCDVI